MKNNYSFIKKLKNKWVSYVDVHWTLFNVNHEDLSVCPISPGEHFPRKQTGIRSDCISKRTLGMKIFSVSKILKAWRIWRFHRGILCHQICTFHSNKISNLFKLWISTLKFQTLNYKASSNPALYLESEKIENDDPIRLFTKYNLAIR